MNVPRVELTVRLAEAKHGDKLIDLLARQIDSRSAAFAYDWITRRNPHGRAYTLLALTPNTGEIVGFSFICPRMILSEGRGILGGVIVPPFIRPERCGSGAELALELALESALYDAARGALFADDVPFQILLHGRSSDAAIESAKTLPILTIDLLFARRPHVPASSFFKNLIRVVSPRARIAPVSRVSQEFDELWHEMTTQLRTVCVRDSEYVRWAHLENPISRRVLLAITRYGDLIGWAVLELGSGRVELVDYLFPLDPLGAHESLGLTISYVTAQYGRQLTLRIPSGGAYLAHVASHGMVVAEKMPVTITAKSVSLLRTLGDASGWHLTEADRPRLS